MQFIDLKTQYLRIETQVQKAVSDVVASQQYILGPQVRELEEKLASYVGVKHVLSCSNGTDALVIALMAYDLSPTDAVFVPSFTFFASAESITLAGATPVFVDSDADTFNITVGTLEEAFDRVVKEGKLTPRGIMAVDLFGLPVDYEQISAFAKKHGLFLIEDAAQSFGASYLGQKACSFGDAAATSFFPAKPLGCYGDGGAVFTNDDHLADLYHSIRVHGQGEDKYDNVRIGLNARLDTIQAAVLLEKLVIFDDEIAQRNRVAAAYTQRLHDVIKTPIIPQGYGSAWAQYSLVAASNEQREEVLESLKQANIPTNVYYRIPIHLSGAYKHLGYPEGSLEVCEDLARRIVSLPMHPYLSDDDIELITEELRKAL
ncbi:MAG: DegT/DnrJ/EryC1/StrS family aminotransferase [Propionibacteriaceae bacterium]|nr:DegT/DnrJ/EryC1/StrS family aminotransferase [Propionibacteriaceae bacterium]